MTLYPERKPQGILKTKPFIGWIYILIKYSMQCLSIINIKHNQG